LDGIIAYDLGTGGIKASLYDENGVSLASSFEPYDTYYTGALLHEQKPADWWNGIILSTRKLLEKSSVKPSDIAGLSISGHSLGVIPVDKDGILLREKTPIWSDARAREQASRFFTRYEYDRWYMKTGNGFPAELYSIFKIMWYQDKEPEVYAKTFKFLGTKDYINYRLTGVMLTDPSYASGSGVYSLIDGKYDEGLLAASGVSREKLTDIIPSTHLVGSVTKVAAQATGLTEGTRVFCGGVDNSCMALGATCYKAGRAYTSLGSSAWIAVSAPKPLVDNKIKPFIFAHVVPGQFASAVSIFSAGNSFRWIRDNICRDLAQKAKDENTDPYILMGELAQQSPIGANKLIFNPNLAGGAAYEYSPNIRGGYCGLVLGHTTSDMVRAAMDGISMNLGVVLGLLRSLTDVSNDMIFVGGGSKSDFWRQIFADVYRCNIVKTNIDQDAASLGAAALAAVGLGLWKDFSPIDAAHTVQDIRRPIEMNVGEYEKYIEVFKKVSVHFAQIGDMLNDMN
jgi:xylulokinase